MNKSGVSFWKVRSPNHAGYFIRPDSVIVAQGTV